MSAPEPKVWPWLTEDRAFALCGTLALLAVALRMGYRMTALAALLIFAICGVLPIVGHVLSLRNKGNCDE